MDSDSAQDNKTNTLLCLTAALIALTPVFYALFSVQIHYFINGNISWLLIAADRYWHGFSFSQHIYETNPPLSILLYSPHILLASLTGKPLASAVIPITLLMVGLTTLLTERIISKIEFIKTHERLCITAAFFIASTLTAAIDFADREHLIIMWLIPFIFIQYAITYNFKIPRGLSIPTLILGSILILVKPHYGLLPTIALIHRMIIQRKFFGILKDTDFIILSLSTLTYIILLLTLLNDYTFNILPDVWHLYFRIENPQALINNMTIPLILTICMLLMEITQEDLTKEKRTFILFVYTAALLCFIPYLVQMKGFFNHLLPAKSFFLIGLGASISFRMELIKQSAAIKTFIGIIALTLTTYMLSPVQKHVVTKDRIETLPLAQFLKKECSQPCTFFAFHSDIEIVNPTAAQLGYTHASRFPSFWFLPKIIPYLYDLENGTIKPEEEDQEKTKQILNLRQKYAGYFLEDLKYYKPEIILIGTNFSLAHIPKINFLKHMLSTKEAESYFYENYELDKTLKFNRGDYFAGTTMGNWFMLEYAVYKRKDNHLKTNTEEP